MLDVHDVTRGQQCCRPANAKTGHPRDEWLFRRWESDGISVTRSTDIEHILPLS